MRGPFAAPRIKRVIEFLRVASSDFQTDWGTRGRASSASTYDPNSHASGSVWGIGTSDMAATFWSEHRPATALSIWNALVPWTSLDSLGLMHEALAGGLLPRRSGVRARANLVLRSLGRDLCTRKVPKIGRLQRLTFRFGKHVEN